MNVAEAVERAHGCCGGASSMGVAYTRVGSRGVFSGAPVRPLDGLDNTPRTPAQSTAARILADGLARASRLATEPTP